MARHLIIYKGGHGKGLMYDRPAACMFTLIVMCKNLRFFSCRRECRACLHIWFAGISLALHRSQQRPSMQLHHYARTKMLLESVDSVFLRCTVDAIGTIDAVRSVRAFR